MSLFVDLTWPRFLQLLIIEGLGILDLILIFRALGW
jgi:hypothetical protein